MRMFDEQLRGMTVISADGQAVGEVTALTIDNQDWRVESLKVDLRKPIADHLGASRTLFHAGSIAIPVRLVQSTSDAVVLTVAVEELRAVVAVPTEDAVAP